MPNTVFGMTMFLKEAIVSFYGTKALYRIIIEAAEWQVVLSVTKPKILALHPLNTQVSPSIHSDKSFLSA